MNLKMCISASLTSYGSEHYHSRAMELLSKDLFHSSPDGTAAFRSVIYLLRTGIIRNARIDIFPSPLPLIS